ncbi:hypothetical protein BDW75DRAFT_222248 [Aspergillus navahoensis]
MNLLKSATDSESRIQNACAAFAQLSACEGQLPLFILGCDARTGLERSTILHFV